MASATSEPPSIKNDSVTLQEQNGDAGSIDNLKRRSTFSEQQIESKQADPVSEKALEEASPAYDESKILSGRKLFFAFVAMLLSVLLIALGMSFRCSDSCRTRTHPICTMQTKPSLPLLCEKSISGRDISNVWLTHRQPRHRFTLLSTRGNQLDSQCLLFDSYVVIPPPQK